MPIINQNKHSPKYRNYNIGNVVLKVLVEPYCPFTPEKKIEYSQRLFFDLLQNVSREERFKMFGVKDTEGLFLKPKILFRSTFLINKNSDSSNQNEAVYDIYGREAVKDKLGKDGLEYFEQQQFYVDEHPINNILNRDQAQKPNSDVNDANSKSPSWQHISEPLPTVNITPSSGGAGGGPSDSPGGLFAGIANNEDNILIPQQQNQNEGEPNNLNPANNIGVHWKITKLHPLYKGEDFYILFTKTTLRDAKKQIASEDIPSDIKGPWNAHGVDYTGLNSFFEPDNVNNFVDINDYDNLPVNLGLVNYGQEFRSTQQNGEIDQIKFVPDEESRENYNLITQSYIIVEIGTDASANVGSLDNITDRRYFIFIPENANPVFLRMEDGAVHNLGRYSVLGKSILSQDFIMTVRNHLGQLIITFSGQEDNPWIIDGVRISPNDHEILLVPPKKISIWGGNINAAVGFGPIQYTRRGVFALPPGIRVHGQGYSFTAFDGESINTENQIVAELHSGIIAEHGDGYKRIPQSEHEYGANNTRIYTCDANLVVENLFVPPDSPGEPGEVAIGNTTLKPPYKGISDVASGEPLQIKEPSGEPESNYSAIGLFASDITIDQGDETSKQVFIQAALKAGDHLFTDTPVTNINGIDNPAASGETISWTLEDCKTPILTYVKIFNVPRQGDLWPPIQSQDLSSVPNLINPNGPGADISRRVLSFSEEWSASDYSSIEHTGSMKILLNPAISFGDQNSQPEEVKFFEKLARRQFFVTIDVAYEKCSSSGNCDNRNKNQYSKLADVTSPQGQSLTDVSGEIGEEWDFNSGIRLFTGIAEGGQITYEAGSRIMNVQLKDYTDILKNTRLINYPFFDGMRDINAIHEIIEDAGFKKRENFVPGEQFPDPGSLTSQASRGTGTTFELSSFDTTDSRQVVIGNYALPMSYDRLQNPSYKPDKGSSVYDFIKTVADAAGKVFFFDNFGVFHFENRKFDDHIFGAVGQGGQSLPFPIEVDWIFRTTLPNATDPNPEEGMLVFNSGSISYDIVSIYNDILATTSTPTLDLVFAREVNSPSIRGNDPNDGVNKPDGFLGYPKLLLKQSGIFGSERAIRGVINHYSRFFLPPREVSFETYGQPIRALDVGKITMPNGEEQLFTVNSASSTIDAQENKWWQNISGDWLTNNS